MDLIQLRYFLTLAKTLNFTRAAEMCNVTQPTMTKTIQRLESELGGALLLRERNHTQLTPLGSAMLPLLQQTFDAAQTARLSALRFRQRERALLRIGLGIWVEPSVVAPLIQQIGPKFPDLEVTVRHGDQTALNEMLLGSEIDVLLTADVERLTDRANRWEVFVDPLVALLPEDHPLARVDSLNIEQLREQVFIGKFDVNADHTTAHVDLRRRLALTTPPRHWGSTDEHVHNLVRAGMGVALSTGRRALPPGIARRTVQPAQTLSVFVAAIGGRPVPHAADAFLRLARARDWNA